MDNVIMDDDDLEELLNTTGDKDTVLLSGGFFTKHWIMSGLGRLPGSFNKRNQTLIGEGQHGQVIVLPNAVSHEKTLGQGLDPITDKVFPCAHVNYSKKMQKMRMGDHLLKDKI